MVLSLATAQECSDAIMMFENDDLMARAKAAARAARMYTAAGGGGGAATGGGGAASSSGATAAAMARAAARASRTGRAIDGGDVRISTADVNDVAGEDSPLAWFISMRLVRHLTGHTSCRRPT